MVCDLSGGEGVKGDVVDFHNKTNHSEWLYFVLFRFQIFPETALTCCLHAFYFICTSAFIWIHISFLSTWCTTPSFSHFKKLTFIKMFNLNPTCELKPHYRFYFNSSPFVRLQVWSRHLPGKELLVSASCANICFTSDFPHTHWNTEWQNTRPLHQRKWKPAHVAFGFTLVFFIRDYKEIVFLPSVTRWHSI